jgi:hypothetical protein
MSNDRTTISVTEEARKRLNQYALDKHGTTSLTNDDLLAELIEKAKQSRHEKMAKAYAEEIAQQYDDQPDDPDRVLRAALRVYNDAIQDNEADEEPDAKERLERRVRRDLGLEGGD